MAAPLGAAPAHAAPADAEVATLFAQLRVYLRLPIGEVAVRLGTDPRVIAALESGRADLLPHWLETHRVVVAYGALAGIDTRAVLDRLALQFDRLSRPRPDYPVARDQAAGAGVGQIVNRLARQPEHDTSQRALMPGFAELLEQATVRSARLRDALAASIAGLRARKHPVRWVLAAAMAVVVAVSVAPYGMLQASVGGLSSPLTGLLRGISDQLTLASAPLRDGHRWIEVDDPRQRRSDKLQSPGS